MKEYGSNVQKLADYIISLPDKEQRTKYAHILIELMRQIHPNMREGQDYSKKLWDDLYIITNFDLDVDSPFPAPPKEILGKKPMIVPYNQNRLKHRYYGRNLEILVLKAIVTETYEERKAFVSYLVRLMKQFYQSWNKDSIETEDCLQQILELSGFKLQAEIDDLRANGLMDSSPKDGNSNRPRQQMQANPRNNNNNNQRNNNQRNNNNNNRNGRDNRDNRDNRSGGGGFKSRDNRDNNRRRR